MPARVLSKKDERFIRRNYLKMDTSQMKAILGHPRGTIKSFMRRDGLKISPELTEVFRRKAINRGYAAKHHPEDELIKELYLLMPQKTLAEFIGRSDTFLYGRMRKLGLAVPPELKEEWVTQSRIKAGNVPTNKGRKQIDYMSKEAIERTKATRFKKGEPNHNELFDGAITIRWRNDNQKRCEAPHWYIRISKSTWQELQMFEWERVHGPVPRKHVLTCKDGDTLNVHPENWKPIPMKENMLRNSASMNLTDGFVAFTLASKKNPHLVEVFKQHPELIDLKRQSLILKRTINEKRSVSSVNN
jgi:hypothetical protein